ncbi:hypothetical protein DBIPINDM_008419 (plasmid) [Mesorhizobium sp. AR02]|uniref:hypothetical protein n=1 Tax=unclassified Mesorhizobium TaxID=325217 RepID=UPI00215F6067|nr:MULTISPECIES: hypothetical protein [unclassified Mesorhizobium]UVK42006.1 hypothetical protein BPNPMPFG_003639 [Mesorhizobium sp. AR07]UVK57454.1 hypothetical protein DBIPINDM_008419 [Mesorhizobium sp. AR02]
MNTSQDDTDEPVDSEAAQIATQYGISVFKAREIMDRCGENVECIKELAVKAHRQNPEA